MKLLTDMIEKILSLLMIMIAIALFSINAKAEGSSINWREECIRFIKGCESCKLEAYLCPSGIPTIGWGHTGKDVVIGMKITQEQADELLISDFTDIENKVKRELRVRLSDYQFYSLVSFTYNSGVGNLRSLINRTKNSSPNIDRLNQGNFDSIEIVMPLYRKSNGKILDGLVKRRAQEINMFKGIIPKNW